MREIERKFLVKELPELDDFAACRITQWYLSKPTDDVSIRIRLYDDTRCYYDMKQGLGKIRQEMGWKCSFTEVRPFLKHAECIKKIRYKKYIDDILLVIDVFESGLKLIEIESDHESSVDNFDIPEWFGEEVTGKIEYTNNWIAYNQLID